MGMRFIFVLGRLLDSIQWISVKQAALLTLFKNLSTIEYTSATSQSHNFYRCEFEWVKLPCPRLAPIRHDFKQTKALVGIQH